MKEIWKKYKLWIVLAGYLAFFALAAMLVVAPLKRKASENVDQLQQTEIENEMNKEKTARIPEMEKQQEYFQEKRPLLNGFLDSNNEVDFIRKLEALADETDNKIDLKIEETSPNSEKKTASVNNNKKDSQSEEDIVSTLPYPSYTIVNISLEGDYQGLFNFIRKLENFDYYVNVVSLKLQASAAESENNFAGDSPFMAGSEKKEVSKDSKKNQILKSELRAVVYVKK